jgi:catechol 2,3-dioxygenase-like lactoylglutathione lyase family enzyme
MRFAVDRLDHLVINCRDLEVMASWYQRVLGMDREIFGEQKRTALRFGGQKINLRPHDHPTDVWTAAANRDPGTQDLCFVVTFSAMDVVAHLHGCGVMIVEGPVTREGALGAMKSVYCRDPDGNLIEISSYSD